MTIRFTPNERPTVGVELELNVIDVATGDLVSASTAARKDGSSGTPADDHRKGEHELFQSTVELITGVCESAEEAGADLRGRMTAELREAWPSNTASKLISSGTHPFAFARGLGCEPRSSLSRPVEHRCSGRHVGC